MREIKLPFLSDRLTGFTIPRGGSFYICDHDEVRHIQIAKVPLIEETEFQPYDFPRDNPDFVGLHFRDYPLNAPLKQVGESSISYDFNPKADFVTLKYTICGQNGEIKFRTMSGDWFCASLSDDGAYLVLADPYGLGLYDLTGN